MIMRRTDDEDDKGGDTSTDDEGEGGEKTCKYNLSVIAVHDCVFVNAGEEEPYVAQVRAIYVDDHHKIHLSVIWFYRYPLPTAASCSFDAPSPPARLLFLFRKLLMRNGHCVCASFDPVSCVVPVRPPTRA